jgi:hypothetical protein
MTPSLQALSQPPSLPEYKRWLDLPIPATYAACSNDRIVSCVKTAPHDRAEWGKQECERLMSLRTSISDPAVRGVLCVVKTPPGQHEAADAEAAACVAVSSGFSYPSSRKDVDSSGGKSTKINGGPGGDSSWQPLAPGGPMIVKRSCSYHRTLLDDHSEPDWSNHWKVLQSLLTKPW